jgi:hypothetical protein
MPYNFKSGRAEPHSSRSSVQVEFAMKSEMAAILPVVDELMVLISKSVLFSGMAGKLTRSSTAPRAAYTASLNP